MADNEDDKKTVDGAVKNFNDKLDKFKSTNAQQVGEDFKELGQVLGKSFEPYYTKLERRIVEKFKKYDEGINYAVKRATAAHVKLNAYKEQVMTSIKTAAWVVGIISALAGILSFFALIVGK